MQVYLNGKFIPDSEATIPVTDRGFIFGDGVYEVIRVIDGRLFREKEHLDRLEEGLVGLQINVKADQLQSLSKNMHELLNRNSLLEGEATLYLQITRGAASPRTHTFPEPEVEPTIFLSTTPFKPHRDLHESGTDAITLPDLRWARCHLKTVNLLPNILARQQAVDAGVDSAVMIRDGMITESPNANIFGVRQGVLYTYPDSPYILSGITRQLVFELAEELSIPVKTVPILAKDLFDLDELFFSGTTTDIQPVVEIDGKPIGEGKPGDIVRKIQKAFRQKLYGASDA